MKIKYILFSSFNDPQCKILDLGYIPIKPHYLVCFIGQCNRHYQGHNIILSTTFFTSSNQRTMWVFFSDEI